MAVTRTKADGTSARDEKVLRSETEAISACELLARELRSRGYVEQLTPGSSRGMPVAPLVAAPPPKPKPSAKPVAPAPEPAEDIYGLEEAEEPVAAPAPALPRLGNLPASAGAGSSTDGTAGKQPKKQGRKKKRKKAADSGDGLDRRVIAGAGAAGAILFGLIGYLAYDAFLKPASIVGTWQGSRLEYETGSAMSYMQYRLVLDEQKRAAVSFMGDDPSFGTYEVKGDRLVLTLEDPDAGGGGHDEIAAADANGPDEAPGVQDEGEGEDAEADDPAAEDQPEDRSSIRRLEYKISLGRATLDLFEPETGRKVVQLVRQREKPSIGGPAKAPAAPKEVATADVAGGDPAQDAQLASVQFSPKDGAFKIKHPAGWEVETGSRPDNTYSWARFTKGGAKIQVYADVVGSLMTGSPIGQQYPEGSELAPVHRAHELYKRTISEEYAEYNESAPTVFKGSQLGEGRIAAFTAKESGLFGGEVSGYRVTLLTNDRRITVMCQCPGRDLEKMKPTFFAVCRSVSR
jgi:hypothetical protein